MREKISACITAGNEENNIRRCLDSVTWADEIVVVDSFSTDRTPEICAEYTSLVYKHKWLGYIGQKNLIKDLASHHWILFIDADEEISSELRDEILDEFNSERCADFAGYEFPRKVWHLGKWITHGDWYPDLKLRLFLKEKGRCGGKEPHDRISVDGRIKRLQGNMNHYSYTGLADQVTTLNRFSSISAEGWHQDGRTFRWVDLFFRPTWRFIRSYILRGGFLDGPQGYIIARATHFATFIKYAKLWELHHARRHQAERDRVDPPKQAT